MTNPNPTLMWLLVTTAIPYGGTRNGHVIVEGVGLDADYTHPHKTQLAWAFEDNKLVDVRAFVDSTSLVTRDIELVDNAGKVAFKLPAGPGAHALVSYAFTEEGNQHVTGWEVEVYNPNEPSARFGFTTVKVKVSQSYSTTNAELPVGVPIPWVGEVVPDGFLGYFGQAFDKVRYPELALLFPSGVLLDFRGEFIRGADGGRGIDAGRVVGSLQSDAQQPITGSFGKQSTYINGNHSMAGAFTYSASTVYTIGSSYHKGGGIVRFDSSRVVRTAAENRPRNLACTYITKAG